MRHPALREETHVATGRSLLHKLVHFAHYWPPACRAYAPVGIMEHWNMEEWVNQEFGMRKGEL